MVFLFFHGAPINRRRRCRTTIWNVRCASRWSRCNALPSLCRIRCENWPSTDYRFAACVAFLCAFSVGALWLRLHEVNDSIVHVVEWHYLPMLGFALVGFGLEKLLKW